MPTEYEVTSEYLLAAMHNHASTNNVAMRTISILYPSVLDIGCYSHTIDHVGEKFSTPTLYEFGVSWVSLFAHSAKARALWRTRTGRSMASYSKTRWWSRWGVYHQILVQFGDVLPFLEQNIDLTHTTCLKLLTIVKNPQTCCNYNLNLLQ